MNLNVVDLFAGLRGWSKPWETRQHRVWSTDIDPKFGCSLTTDILVLEPSEIPFKKVDVVLASPPCDRFSVATIGKNWMGGNKAYVPRHDGAKHAMELVKRAVWLIEELKPDFAVIENPRGLLRKLDLIPPPFEMRTVSYCSYGETRMKPTDLWASPWPPHFDARKCNAGAGPIYERKDGRLFRCDKQTGEWCHESAPRGARTGTQGFADSKARAEIPFMLSMEVCLAVERMVL